MITFINKNIKIIKCCWSSCCSDRVWQTTNQPQSNNLTKFSNKNIDVNRNPWHKVRNTGKINQIGSTKEIDKTDRYNNISHNDLTKTTCWHSQARRYDHYTCSWPSKSIKPKPYSPSIWNSQKIIKKGYSKERKISAKWRSFFQNVSICGQYHQTTLSLVNIVGIPKLWKMVVAEKVGEEGGFNLHK